MTLQEIAEYRLINQQMTGTKFSKPEEIVSWLGAMQSQEYSLSKWAIGLRLPGCADEDVEQAFTSGKILRTHLLRPTWHFVTPADIRWMLALTSPRVNALNRYMYRKMELDNKIFTKANEVMIKALQGGRQLTRADIQDELKRKKIIADSVRLSCIMMQSELAGIICSGARIGKQFTYALIEERVPSVKKIDKEQALAALTQRYFDSRGPATLKDFSVWSGLTIAQVKRGLEMTAANFTHTRNGNDIYYSSRNTSFNKGKLNNAILLPPYDEYIMGYKDKAPIFAERNKIIPLPKLIHDNTILLNGRVTGSWRRVFENKSISIEYHVFKSLSKQKLSALNKAMKKFKKFMGLPVSTVEKANFFN